jgi:hypothetical protein
MRVIASHGRLTNARAAIRQRRDRNVNTSQRHRWIIAHLVERASSNGTLESVLLAALVLAVFVGALHSAG